VSEVLRDAAVRIYGAVTIITEAIELETGIRKLC
jgi:hypothetical protein